jgi:hypothetical protein
MRVRFPFPFRLPLPVVPFAGAHSPPTLFTAMTAWVHLSAMLGSAALAVILIRRHARKPARRRVALALLALVVPVLALSAGLHRCDCGVPLSQWLIPSAALLAVVLLVEPVRLSLIASAVLALLAVGLSFHYAGAVHGPTWVGNPESFTLPPLRARAEWHTALTGLYRRVPAAEP